MCHRHTYVSINGSLGCWSRKNRDAFLLGEAVPGACCAKSCQDTEQLWGELRGLDGSYTQCFGEVINSWPSIYFCKALVKQP